MSWTYKMIHVILFFAFSLPSLLGLSDRLVGKLNAEVFYHTPSFQT